MRRLTLSHYLHLLCPQDWLRRTGEREELGVGSVSSVGSVGGDWVGDWETGSTT